MPDGMIAEGHDALWHEAAGQIPVKERRKVDRISAVAAVVVLVTSARAHGPPPAPAGYVWVVNKAFSDEFDGDRLDKAKWHDHHPYWKGRPPAKFVPGAVSVANGMLRITNGPLGSPDGKFTIAGGAVVSRSAQALYGYYEARMKASRISMSSTFWLTNRPKLEADGARTKQELDINEAVGEGKKHPGRKHFMKSNTHYFHTKGGKRADKAVRGQCRISPPAGEAFHTYGAWWVDANTIRFYHNGKHKFTIRPSTHYDKTPFDRPMYMNLVTETYDWETPPTPEELRDSSRNTTYYDWVRSYTLVKKGRTRGKESAGEAGRSRAPRRLRPDRLSWKLVPELCDPKASTGKGFPIEMLVDHVRVWRGVKQGPLEDE